VLVIGGSLGSLALNETVPAAIAQLDSELRPEVWHQTGRNGHEQAIQLYANASLQAKVESFIDDMAAAYAWADLVICRAGALTIAELAAAGVASVLVPYPYAVDDHQTVNGQFLEQTGAAMIVQQYELSAGLLAGILKELLASRERLLKMALAARKQARVDATEVVASHCLMAMQG
jgi:UDP-N-acetylglucosamine--N-acetylmuramyl-(pentapeptide) pyrophosphoryl-undecaprenol N-acetylglucosamine transferase